VTIITGKTGRLTSEQMGQSMPVDAPLYQQLPFYYKDAMSLTITYETDRNAVLNILPDCLELDDGPAMAQFSIIDYPWTTFGEYQEAFLRVNCLWQGQPKFYAPYMVLTTESPMAAGREIWGIPKKLAKVEIRQEQELYIGTVERPSDSRLATLLLRPERREDLPDGGINCLYLRVIPSPEEGAPPSLCELIEITGVERQLKELWSGTGSLSFDTMSQIDPWYRLEVRNIVSAVYSVADFTLGHGSIVKRY
jgi:acetoacetate decarboxylase